MWYRLGNVARDHAIGRATCTIGNSVFGGTAVALAATMRKTCRFGTMGGSGPTGSLPCTAAAASVDKRGERCSPDNQICVAVRVDWLPGRRAQVPI